MGGTAVIHGDKKRCYICHEWKPFSEFNKNNRTHSKLAAQCGRCHNEDGKKYYLQLKLQTFTYYSKSLVPVCACCGENTFEFLALDHINGGGGKHRKEVGTGFDFYRWIRRNHYPTGFQVLCHNCNQAKAFYRECPHKRKI